MPSNPEIISICFRNKTVGWKMYNMELKTREKTVNMNGQNDMFSFKDQI